MQKNDKFYTFLLSQNKKDRIYIRRVEISKQLLHFGSVGIFLFIGLSVLGVGVSGVVRSTVLAKSLDNVPVTAQMARVETPAADDKDIDYSRPSQYDNLSFNSGGPEQAENNDPEDEAIDAQLRDITSKVNAAYLPTMWAHLGKINNEFGFRRNPFGGRSYEFHAGMDIDGERGDLVVAPANGTVVKASWSGGYGNMIEIEHAPGLTTRYGHLSKLEVNEGDTVTRGQLIALVGSTGRSTGPHLHYELRLNDKPINPRRFLPPEPTEVK